MSNNTINLIEPRIVLATACGDKKLEGAHPAHQLYRSPRIRALYRSRGDFPLYILSAKYGLIHSEQVICCYQMVMDEMRANELAPQVADVMRGFDRIVYFKGGARKEYIRCIKLASDLSGVPAILVGYGFMGAFRECSLIAEQLRRRHPPR
jgi:hypothetical protein